MDHAKARTARSVIGLIGVVGFAATILIALGEDAEIGAPSYVWALAFITAVLFWVVAGPFIERPSAEGLRNLRTAGYSFIFTWVVAAFVTYAVWEELVATDMIGVGACVLGTFLVIQLINEGQAHLRQAEASRADSEPHAN